MIKSRYSKWRAWIFSSENREEEEEEGPLEFHRHLSLCHLLN